MSELNRSIDELKSAFTLKERYEHDVNLEKKKILRMSEKCKILVWESNEIYADSDEIRKQWSVYVHSDWTK